VGGQRGQRLKFGFSGNTGKNKGRMSPFEKEPGQFKKGRGGKGVPKHETGKREPREEGQEKGPEKKKV